MDQTQGSGRRTDPSTRPDATRGSRHGTPGKHRGAMTKRTHQPVDPALLFLDVSLMRSPSSSSIHTGRLDPELLSALDDFAEAYHKGGVK